MLLIDDDQRKLLEQDRGFYQGMGPHDDPHQTLRDFTQESCSLGQTHPLSDKTDDHPKRLKIAAQDAGVLLCQQLRWDHQRNLIAALHRDGHEGGRHHRFATADIPLKQPQHRACLTQLTDQLIQDLTLTSGQGKGKALEECSGQRSLRLIALGFFTMGEPSAPERKPHLHQEQLFKREPPPGFFKRAPALRKMDLCQGPGTRSKVLPLTHGER
jgi:hypothetical protein